MEMLKNQYLIFEVDEAFAIELEQVIEIVEYANITCVPETPEYIAGVINLRGHVVPVIDMRVRFMKKAKADNDRRCIIIVNFEDNQLGLVVDNVVDLIQLEDENLSEPPQVGNDYAHVFIKQIGVHNEKMNLIVDVDKLVNYNEISFAEELRS